MAGTNSRNRDVKSFQAFEFIAHKIMTATPHRRFLRREAAFRCFWTLLQRFCPCALEWTAGEGLAS